MIALPILLAAAQASPETGIVFDFAKSKDALGWQAAHDVSEITPGPNGLAIDIAGGDPYVIGPISKLGRRTPAILEVRLRSDEGGSGQVFFFGPGESPTEERAVRFPVRAGVMETARVRLPAIGPDVRLRFDPPGTRGRCLLESIKIVPREPAEAPAWTKPRVPALPDGSPALHLGALTFTHARAAFGSWALDVAGKRMAIGYASPLLGYEIGGKPRWFPLPSRATVKATADSITATATSTDKDGGHWRFVQKFSKAGNGVLEVEASVSCDMIRRIVFVPVLIALPGAGSFGTSKAQAVFPGLEYLDKDEPSSSEADIAGPGSKRQVPDSVKVTMPLMGLVSDGRTFGLSWEPAEGVAALFDSPDRVFGSGGHVFGLIAPGSKGSEREPGALVADEPTVLTPPESITVRAQMFGGRGASVVPLVQDWVHAHGLPEVPKVSRAALLQAEAAGWLSSGVREGTLYRHAYWPGVSMFNPVPSAEAAALMLRLARHPEVAAEAAGLETASKEALGVVDPSAYATSTLSHEPTPVAPLVFGHVEEAVVAARRSAEQLLKRFEPDGTVRYRPEKGGTDYGRTHFAKDASGPAAWAVRQLLVDASLCGDKALTAQALSRLDGLSRYADGVPRGAQTWEVPLHTPDILASALMVECYDLGYRLSGRKSYLEQAEYWAWTGLPFVYLVPPVEGKVGVYASIAVFGATNWTAPDWMGMPVQWCGLVLADALYHLAEDGGVGPWRQVADGITASGFEQVFPKGDPKLYGLLPDSFNLRPQSRNGVAINPGTLQVPAERMLGSGPVYDMTVFPTSGVIAHVPGSVRAPEEKGTKLAFWSDGWPRDSYYVLLSGLTGAKSIRVDGFEVKGTADCMETKSGCTVLRVQGRCRIEVDTGR